ncbi:MAG: ferrous iron transport protein A, partial [Candidatus Methanomethyliaceae archaeon]|nr:ferrous iron transport protein A [Candidatus Methanomethyliaceae archaeon]
MLEEIIEIFCKIKAKLGKVTREDMKKEGLREEDIDSAIREGLLIEKYNGLEITSKGEKKLLNHRESFLHNSIIHEAEDAVDENLVMHWIAQHGITEIDEFYERLKALPYRIEELTLLAELPEGVEGEVVLIVGGGGVIMRLCSLGITPGTRLKVLRKAPIG